LAISRFAFAAAIIAIIAIIIDDAIIFADVITPFQLSLISYLFY
jgi:hypothetical protein